MKMYIAIGNSQRALGIGQGSTPGCMRAHEN